MKKKVLYRISRTYEIICIGGCRNGDAKVDQGKNLKDAKRIIKERYR